MRFIFQFLLLVLAVGAGHASPPINYQSATSHADSTVDTTIPKKDRIYLLGPERIEESYVLNGSPAKRTGAMRRILSFEDDDTVASLCGKFKAQMPGEWFLRLYRDDMPSEPALRLEGQDIFRSEHALKPGDLLIVIPVPEPRSPSPPSVKSIDYRNPDKYLSIKESLGTSARIEALASQLEDDSQLVTIQNVLEWMDRNLAHDGKRAYSWRNFDDVFDQRCFGGCADEAIFCGVLFKKAGIPTIWVKTMDLSWIRDFKSGRPTRTWSGHVFLEVHVNGRWMLLDPGARTIYQKYSPEARILPGDRFAYDKGDDPKAMIMSLQWKEWKKQTATYFAALDESLLPVDSSAGTSLKPFQAFVIGNSPHYQELSVMAQKNGFVVTKSFNHDYDRNLPAAKGHLLLIETHSGKPLVPREELEKHFPRAFEALDKSDQTTQIAGTDIVFVDFDVDSPTLAIQAVHRTE